MKSCFRKTELITQNMTESSSIGKSRIRNTFVEQSQNTEAQLEKLKNKETKKSTIETLSDVRNVLRPFHSHYTFICIEKMVREFAIGYYSSLNISTKHSRIFLFLLFSDVYFNGKITFPCSTGSRL